MLVDMKSIIAVLHWNVLSIWWSMISLRCYDGLACTTKEISHGKGTLRVSFPHYNFVGKGKYFKESRHSSLYISFISSLSSLLGPANGQPSSPAFSNLSTWNSVPTTPMTTTTIPNSPIISIIFSPYQSPIPFASIIRNIIFDGGANKIIAELLLKRRVFSSEPSSAEHPSLRSPLLLLGGLRLDQLQQSHLLIQIAEDIL